MGAAPILPQIAGLPNRHHLDAILVGDSAAALQGSAVVTLPIEFEFRASTRAAQRLAAIAAELGGALARPFGKSKRLRMALPGGLSVDFVPARAPRRCSEYRLDGARVRAARAPQPREIADRDVIRRWQALPREKRTNFLRVRIGLRGSCL